ncbi:hypothetical protein EVA_13928 [gut metagenome]|uniref:Uncharacterized protein n=1 Tax=gut metagenome TaxID=749906 RepID=J9CDB7_9ZZZZ
MTCFFILLRFFTNHSQERSLPLWGLLSSCLVSLPMGCYALVFM